MFLGEVKKEEMEQCLICRKEISDKTIDRNGGRFCDGCNAKSTVCDAKGCFEKAVWRIIGGKQFCSKHLKDLRADELMY